MFGAFLVWGATVSHLCLFAQGADPHAKSACKHDVTLDLPIQNKVVSPDGFTRSSVLAGGTFPGPLISGKKGDRYRINVIDQLTDDAMLRSTSIHWHGIFQHGSSWADGTSFVTQCPIAPNDSFVYDFTVPDQVGTFWYHSHLSTQYCDGLRGPFVIYNPHDPYKKMYDVDDESTIITLADWYHDYAKKASVDGTPLSSYSTLINGQGRWKGSPANTSLAVINVKKGHRYRFRLIAMSCDPNFTFQIDQHNMTIIEADGEYTTPLTVDQLQIFAGQRYSIIVNANQPVDNYWIRANPDPRGVQGFDGGRNSAIFRYHGASDCDPTTNSSQVTNPLKESNLHALYNPSAPGLPHVGGADINMLLNISADLNHIPFPVFLINNVSFVPPTAPALLQIMSGAQTAQSLLPLGSYYELPRNKVVELTIPGTIFEFGGPHPFHLHGHSFSVVRSGDSDQYNYINPVRRDVVSTGFADGNTTIRFVTDNAGPWFLHCHIDWHLELGLAIVFAEDIPHINATNPTPAAWNNLCPKYNNLKANQL